MIVYPFLLLEAKASSQFPLVSQHLLKTALPAQEETKDVR
jgi:hypothetical protein